MSKTTRPRGFVQYNPRRETQELINTVSRVIDEYGEILPLTIRQLFYILVTRGVMGKTERDYENLIDKMGRARRAHMIPMDVFRDDGFGSNAAPGWASRDELLNSVQHTVREFTLDRQQGQEQRLIVWCEAAGMVPQLERVTHQFGVQTLSSGGFDSLTAKHAIAFSIASDGLPVSVLHIGDHDPSGVHMFGSLNEDITAFINHYSGSINFTRLAVTPEQVSEFDLPTAPPKATDNRSFEGTKTTQAEALDPRTLASIARTAIESRIDRNTLQSVIEQESNIRDELLVKFG